MRFAGVCRKISEQMADNDPDSSYADESIDNLSEYGRGDLVVDHKAEKCSGKHRDNAGAHHGEVRHIEPAEEETDHKDHNIVYAVRTTILFTQRNAWIVARYSFLLLVAGSRYSAAVGPPEAKRP